MKLPVVLLLMSCLVGFGQVSNDPFGDQAAGFDSKSKRLDGVWSRDVGESIAFKHYFSGRFNLSYANRATSIIDYHMIGFFDESNNSARELPKFTTSNWFEFCNIVRPLKIGFEGADILGHFDKDGKKEVWLRKILNAETKSLDGVTDFSGNVTDLDGCWFYNASYKGVPYRSFEVYDRGRWSVTHYYLGSKEVTRHMIGIFSFDGKVLRQKVNYATSNWKEKIGAVAVARVTFSSERSHRQINADGWDQTWSRVGVSPSK